MANDTKVIGKKYRILANAATRAWNVISFWTSARDVEFDDGTTLQATKATIDSSNERSQDLLADIQNAPIYDPTLKYAKGDIVNYNGSFYYCIVDINSPEAWNSNHWRLITTDIPFKFGIDADGNYGYIKAGADSVTPFKSSAQNKILIAENVVGSGSVNASIISQKCVENRINANRLTASNFVMEMNGFTTQGIYSRLSGTDSSQTLAAPSLSFNNGAISYNTGSWRQGGWNQVVWIHGSRGGYDFYIDVQRPGAGNWTNAYHSDSSGTLNEVAQISFDITARCNIYLIA